MSNISTENNKITEGVKQENLELLTRGVEEVFIYDEFLKDLESGVPLRIKLGVDPTGPKIHLGRAIPLRKLRQFQKLGHKIVFIVGDFTAQVGDASDKSEKRPMLTRKEIDENLKDYKSQISKILDLEKTEFVYNNDWLSKLTFQDVTTLSEVFTVQQMLARRNFKERYDAEKEISLREFLYPIMQGYDSYAVKADVEIGGFDQLFNLKAGRDIQNHFGMKKQHVMCLQMLEGTDGRKMSTSWGNTINVVDDPYDMFNKIMEIKDDLIIKYFTLCTDMSLPDIENIKTELEKKSKDKLSDPRDIKMILASEIVTMYHNEKMAAQAKQNFIEVFQNNGIPENTPEIIGEANDTLGDLVVKSGMIDSKTAWKKLVEGNGVSFEDNTQLTDYKKLATNCILRIGKKKFLRIKI